MPRIRPLTETERKNQSVTIQLVGRMKVEKVPGEKMAALMGVSLRTFYRKRDNPECLTLKDIRTIRQIFPGIEIE